MYPIMEGPDRIREIHFSMVPKLGPVLSKKVLEYFKSLEAVFNATLKDFLEIEGIQIKGAEHILRSLENKTIRDRARRELDFIQENRVQCFFILNPDYPFRLIQCPDPPILVYFQGTADINAQKIISIVGSRKATAYGKKLTHEFINGLKGLDLVILSGLAFGIDIQAHRSSMENGIPTIGVLGHGLDLLYPSAHRDISSKMKRNGGLLTEFCSETPILPGLFPRRNRIIAGLSDALVVVEAADKGGALITAELATSYNKEVFAFPGRVNDPYSQGCLGLIRDQKAQLILNAGEFLDFMNWVNPSMHNNDHEEPESAIALKILNILVQKNKVSISELNKDLGSTIPNIPEILLDLEIRGKIRLLPGRILERV